MNSRRKRKPSSAPIVLTITPRAPFTVGDEPRHVTFSDAVFSLVVDALDRAGITADVVQA